MTEVPDDELLEAASNGDREALETLLCASLPELRRLVERRAGSLVRANMGDSDIVQSVCREILTHGDRFQHPSAQAFRRWLHATVLRKLSNRRAGLTAVRRDVTRDVPMARSDGRVVEPLDGDQATPSAQAIVAEELERLEAAMDALPDEAREVIFQARIMGRSREEIARQSGRSPGAVRMQLHRALAQLAVLLDGNGDDPREPR